MNSFESKGQEKSLANYLKALSHPVRLSIIKALLENSRCPHGSHPCNCGESCDGKNCKCGCKCGNLVERLGMSQSTVSQHIKELKSAGLIALESRKGDYTINHSKLKETLELLQKFFELPLNNVQEEKKCECCG